MQRAGTDTERTASRRGYQPGRGTSHPKKGGGHNTLKPKRRDYPEGSPVGSEGTLAVVVRKNSRTELPSLIQN